MRPAIMAPRKVFRKEVEVITSSCSGIRRVLGNFEVLGFFSASTRWGTTLQLKLIADEIMWQQGFESLDFQKDLPIAPPRECLTGYGNLQLVQKNPWPTFPQPSWRQSYPTSRKRWLLRWSIHHRSHLHPCSPLLTCNGRWRSTSHVF